MKRHQLLKHLRANNCRLFREGAKHSIWVCDDSGETTSVPREGEIIDDLARKICKDLAITDIKAR
jgi:hypothetical protein